MTEQESQNEPTPRPRSPEELAKISAETARIEQETRLAESKAKREDEKAQLELKKLELEIAKTKAEATEVQIRAEKAQRDYDELLTGDKYYHIYAFDKGVDSSSAKSCMTQLAQWCRLADRADAKANIEIVFSSPGGSVIDGLMLFDFIMSLRRQGHHINTNTLGYAASMAGILLQAGERRYMAKEAWILIHEISFGAGGKIGEVEDTVNWVKRMQDRVLDIFAERCDQAGKAGTASKPLTKAALKRHWLRQDWWINSDEALKYGLVDEIR